jgi:hypothetical protein
VAAKKRAKKRTVTKGRPKKVKKDYLIVYGDKGQFTAVAKTKAKAYKISNELYLSGGYPMHVIERDGYHTKDVSPSF